MGGPVKLTSDSRRMLADIDKKIEAWFKIWSVAHVPNLLIQKKWFKNDRDLVVGDVVFFKKEESELGDGEWTMGMVDQIIPSRDGNVRQVVVRYRNASENHDRFTHRSVRNLIKLFNVDDPELQDDFTELQRKVEGVVVEIEERSSLPHHASHLTVCSSCCAQHCAVKFHNYNKTRAVEESFPDAPTNFSASMMVVDYETVYGEQTDM